MLSETLDRSERVLDRVEQAAVELSAVNATLTGLGNLILFNDRLDIALSHAERHGWRLAVMFIGLEGFKGVNGTHGHGAGDQVLATMTQRLKVAVRSGDTVSRSSGDEFLFLMLEAKDEANAMDLASRIAIELGKPCDVEGRRVRVGASVGMALYPEDGRSGSQLLRHAEAAMYVAKQSGAGPASFSQIAPLADGEGGSA